MTPHELHLALTDRERPWNEDLAEAADWSEWQDAPVPAGYDTLHGFMSRWEKRVLGGIAYPLQSMAEDVGRLTAEAKRDGVMVVEVPAPTALRRIGFETTMAFPLGTLLAETGINTSHFEWASKIVSYYIQSGDESSAHGGAETVADGMTEDELIAKAEEIMRRRAHSPVAALTA